MALTKMLPSQEQKFFNGSAFPSRLHARTRQNQLSEALHFDSKVRQCDSAVNCSGGGIFSIRNVDEQAEPSSLCLVAMVDEYIEQEASQRETACCHGRCTHHCHGPCIRDHDFGCSCQRSNSGFSPGVKETVQELDSILRGEVVDGTLIAHVVKAMEETEDEKFAVSKQQGVINTKALLRLFVLKYLRRMGYNAGICKSDPESVSGFPPDEHEYIDVIVENAFGKSERLFVDLSFRSQFKIARPSSSYKELLQMLPKTFVGNAFTLQRIVRLMSQAAKISLESQDMHVPPWRRLSFMHAKWFSSYTRTTEAGVPKVCSKMIDREPDQKRVLKDWNNIVNASKGTRVAGISQTQDGSKAKATAREWQPPPAKPRSSDKMEKMAGALAMAMGEVRLNALQKPVTAVPLQMEHSATITV